MKIKGNLKNGQMHGPLEITFLDGSILEARAKDGALHGIARILDVPRPLRFRMR